MEIAMVWFNVILFFGLIVLWAIFIQFLGWDKNQRRLSCIVFGAITGIISAIWFPIFIM